MRKGFRRLVLSSGIWQFKIGKGRVVIFSPSGDRYCPDHSEVLDLPWSVIEKQRWKNSGSDHPANISPQCIKNWIGRNT